MVHCAVESIGGHGTACGDVIIDCDLFDYSAHQERFPNDHQPDPSHHGLVYARDLGVNGAFGVNLSLILKARVQAAVLKSSPWVQAGRQYAPLGTSACWPSRSREVGMPAKSSWRP